MIDFLDTDTSKRLSTDNTIRIVPIGSDTEHIRIHILKLREPSDDGVPYHVGYGDIRDCPVCQMEKTREFEQYDRYRDKMLELALKEPND